MKLTKRNRVWTLEYQGLFIKGPTMAGVMAHYFGSKAC